MNKNKSTGWYYRNMHKYRFITLTFNYLLLLIIFMVFFAVASFYINQRFTQEYKSEINEYINAVKTTMNDARNHTYIKNLGTVDIDENQAITAYYYYKDAKDSAGSIKEYIVGNPLPKDEIKKVRSNDESYFKTGCYGNFKTEKGEHYYTYIIGKAGGDSLYKAYRKDAAGGKQEVDVCYVKLYLNQEDKLKIKEDLNKSLVFNTLAFLILGYLVSYLIMTNSVKPIQEMVEKQVNFVSDASHELRTPLAVLQSKLENILASPNRTVSQVSPDIAVSLQELERLRRLIDNLLLLARSDQRRTELHLKVYNLNLLLNEISLPLIELGKIKARKFYYQGEDVKVRCDKDRMKELIIIFFDNAMKYTDAGDIISLSVKATYNGAVIEFSDTGIGISKNTENKIFERFYREDKARSSETGGSGLGLAIAKTIVDDMKGSIRATANQPKGTKFIVEIPKVK